MRAGSLRQLLIIQRRTDSRDAFGASIPSWATFAQVRGKVSPLSGGESEFARTIDATVSHSITIRYLSGLLPADRVLLGSRIFAIKSILNRDERNIEQTLICSEVAAP